MFHSDLRARAHGDHVATASIATVVFQLEMSNGDFGGHLYPPSIPSASEYPQQGNSLGEEVRETAENSRALGVLNATILVTAGKTQTLSQHVISLSLVCQVNVTSLIPPSAEESPQVVYLSSSP